MPSMKIGGKQNHQMDRKLELGKSGGFKLHWKCQDEHLTDPWKTEKWKMVGTVNFFKEGCHHVTGTH
jgi:hypothetical protein